MMLHHATTLGCCLDCPSKNTVAFGNWSLPKPFLQLLGSCGGVKEARAGGGGIDTHPHGPLGVIRPYSSHDTG